MEHGSRSKTRFCAVFAVFTAAASIASADEVARTVAPNSPDVSVWDGPAGTSVAVNGSDATITVRIDFCCRADDAAGPGGTTGADASENYVLDMVKAAQKIWNDGLANYPARDCLKIKAVFDAKFVEDQQHWDPGYHRIVVHYSANSSGSKDPGSTTRWDDTATVYGQSVGGEFYFGSDDINNNGTMVPALTPNSMAHEIGHLMGLGDDYYKQHSAIAGRCGTLMAAPASGTIDQQLADRLADIIGKTTELRCWKGKLNASLAYASATLDFSFTEKSNGLPFGSTFTGKGTGRVNLSGVYYNGVCSYTRTYTPVDLPIGIGGTRIGEDLELDLKLPSVSFEVTGSCPKNAVGTAHPTMDPKWYGLAMVRAKYQEGVQPITAAWKGSIELKCATCKPGTDRPSVPPGAVVPPSLSKCP